MKWIIFRSQPSSTLFECGTLEARDATDAREQGEKLWPGWTVTVQSELSAEIGRMDETFEPLPKRHKHRGG